MEKIFYLCDGERENCKKRNCYKNGGDCRHTTDISHGIPFRLVCDRCYQRIMSKGYDGEYYTEADEQIEDDY